MPREERRAVAISLLWDQRIVRLSEPRCCPRRPPRDGSILFSEKGLRGLVPIVVAALQGFLRASCVTCITEMKRDIVLVTEDAFFGITASSVSLNLAVAPVDADDIMTLSGENCPRRQP